AHSFGIHVAAMAGMPADIIHRAREILVELEQKTINTKPEADTSTKQTKAPVKNIQPAYQLNIFETVDNQAGKLKSLIQTLDINTMSPIECMLKLVELKKILEEEQN